MCPGVGPQGWLRWLATPLVVPSAGGTCSTLLLLPTPSFCSWLFRSRNQDFFFFFGLLISVSP